MSAGLQARTDDVPLHAFTPEQHDPEVTVPLAHHYLDQEFDVEYCDRHVRRLMIDNPQATSTALDPLHCSSWNQFLAA